MHGEGLVLWEDERWGSSEGLHRAICSCWNGVMIVRLLVFVSQPSSSPGLGFLRPVFSQQAVKGFT